MCPGICSANPDASCGGAIELEPELPQKNGVVEGYTSPINNPNIAHKMQACSNYQLLGS